MTGVPNQAQAKGHAEDEVKVLPAQMVEPFLAMQNSSYLNSNMVEFSRLEVARGGCRKCCASPFLRHRHALQTLFHVFRPRQLRGRSPVSIEYAEYKRRYAEYDEKCAACRKRKEEVLRKAEALRSKRDQWKAVSARYYEHHPEVKEKKRIKAAEQRAAKKLARRRWDPPKDPTKIVKVGRPRSAAARAREREQLGEFPKHSDINLAPEEPYLRVLTPAFDLRIQNLTVTSRSLGAKALTRLNSLGASSEPSPQHHLIVAIESLLGLEAGEPTQSPLRTGSDRLMVKDAWACVAPQYDSRRVLSMAIDEGFFVDRDCSGS
ncbi:hypothetical protein B0H14DRAFT_2642767 [Mycena olivaceomarginata]|nr:hypothetical protein B0H14DRAFT_2642767 [Mycena olivaceomarginata]